MMQPVWTEYMASPPKLLSPAGKPTALSPLSTPLSQATTAPPTPLLSLLPDPWFPSAAKTPQKPGCMPSLPGEEEARAFVRTTSGCSTQVPEEEQPYRFPSAEHDDDDAGCEEFMLDPLPPSPTFDIGVFDLEAQGPSLESALGRWAQTVVESEAWLERGALQKRLGRAPLWREYLVDNSALNADTVGLAFRRSKHSWDRDHTISGPKWGTTVAGVDEGDGWIRVGTHYLPLDLGGTTVLTPRTEALRDGPALTADGRALDLEKGAAISFSHDPRDASGAAVKEKLKGQHRMLRAVRLAHTACEAQARIASGEAVAVDAQGGVWGDMAASVALRAPGGSGAALAARLKRLQRRRLLRRRARGDCNMDPGAALCSGPDGRVFLFLSVREAPEERRERVRRKIALLGTISEAVAPSAAVDPIGVVHF
mmetsp:Transcript_76140/g.219971  ORF Transcript_76140/g.219971 Transcript_76140/m.219971 type:complete len:425 (+) Transcript_76140:104-1378(+)